MNAGGNLYFFYKQERKEEAIAKLFPAPPPPSSFKIGLEDLVIKENRQTYNFILYLFLEFLQPIVQSDQSIAISIAPVRMGCGCHADKCCLWCNVNGFARSVVGSQLVSMPTGTPMTALLVDAYVFTTAITIFAFVDI